MRILPLGSCRIWNPLFSLPEGERPIPLFSGDTVYTHTPAAALAILKVLRRELSLPVGWHKYLTPSPPLLPTPQSEAWVRNAEICFVEVCSEVEYHVGDLVLIDNELIRQLRAPGEEDKSGWWHKLKTGKPFAAVDILDRLKMIEKTRRIDEADRQVISEVRLRRLTPEKLAADLAALRDIVGCPLVVVPHVRFLKDDGRPIESRDRFIETVRATARDMGLRVVDHTALVERVGHRAFWDLDGSDPYHFTSAMNPEVARLMLDVAEAA